ncbi:MAG: cysteine dioxygenase family protein, partial [Pirellulaceae bacterium]|nr:cysteine dioxygenase family protein [Pirellulaceae bacterium]
YTSHIPAEVLSRWVENCPLVADDLIPFRKFHPERYVRNLVHSKSVYHALALCWRNGQRSPIHDHRGSGCAVKVLAGSAVETLFETAPNGMIYPTSSRQLAVGSTCYSEDADIHQVSNLQADGADLVTLHLYSPPLQRMNMYSMEGEAAEFIDPINREFASGAGI